MGQITLQTELGQALYSLCRNRQDVNTVVEIGTYDGLGSTDCIIRGLANSGKPDVVFFSLEADRNRFRESVGNWSGLLPSWAQILHGRIVETNQMDSSALNSQEQDWFNQDVRAFESCSNIADLLPQTIDLLFLDGGEFSTYSEFQKLSSRSRIVVLDDSIHRKGRLIRNAVMSSQDYYILFDKPYVNNGIFAFERKETNEKNPS